MPKTLWQLFDEEPNREEPTMNTYVEVKAGTPCRVITADGSIPLTEYPEDDLLKVTDQFVHMITCGSFIFHESNVRVIKP